MLNFDIHTFIKSVDLVAVLEQITNNGCMMRSKSKGQESPPAWTQEAYRPLCSEYSFCCPILADPPSTPRLDWPDPPPDWTDPPPPCEQTNKVKLLPSRRTTYAGGKNSYELEKDAIALATVYRKWTTWKLIIVLARFCTHSPRQQYFFRPYHCPY